MNSSSEIDAKLRVLVEGNALLKSCCGRLGVQSSIEFGCVVQTLRHLLIPEKAIAGALLCGATMGEVIASREQFLKDVEAFWEYCVLVRESERLNALAAQAASGASDA